MTLFFLNNSKIIKGSIPDFVLIVLERLEGAGFLSFLVGGCVRDLIHHKTSRDWDIVTDASLEQIQNIFSDYRVLLIGKSFQTATLIVDSHIFHVSAIRCNGNEKNLLAEKERYHFLAKDLLCRDFTINSLAWNPTTGILDPSGGLQDLQKKVIRSLRPAERFQEDPLRMIRAIRIACQLNFTINRLSKNSIIEYSFLINKVSPERIKEELCSILKTSRAGKGLAMLRQYGLEQHIFSLNKTKKELLNIRKIRQISFSGLNEFKENLPARLALWGRVSFGSCLKAQMFYLPLLYHLKFNKRILKQLKNLLSIEWITMDFNSGKDIRFLMSELGKENIKVMFYLKKILLLYEKNYNKLNKLKIEGELLKKELKKKPPISLKNLAIQGEDLIKVGIPGGKKIGDMLGFLLKEVLISPESNNKECLMNIIEKVKKEYTK